VALRKPPRKHRIGYDLRWKQGTLDHYVGNLLAALVEAGENEFDFVVYGHPEHRGVAESLNGRVLFREVSWPRYSLREQTAFRRVLGADGVDLLHCPFYVAPLASGVPTIVTIHDMIPFTEFSEKRGLNRLIVCMMTRIAARRSAAILTVSEASKNDIVRMLGVPESKVTVAHCALGRYAFIEAKPGAYASRAPYFACMTARHIGSKNTLAAVRAWRIFRERTGLPHRLLIGGRTSEQGQALLARAGCGDGCELLGFVPDDNLSSFFGCSQAFIIPSFYEGFGIPALEAMAAGAPVLSSNAASLPEVCGDAALYFNPSNPEELADHMIRICEDPNLRAQMIARGRVRSGQFAYRQSAGRIVQLYRELLHDRRKKPEGVEVS
jgi:glycosyltransferase involved in cell wall biosynthesis